MANKPMGRPTIYTEELANRICELVAANPFGLKKLCRLFPEIPTYETINVWRWNKKDFSDLYTQAKRIQSEILAESIEDVADELIEKAYIDELGITKIDSGMLGHARLVCDNRKWTASKLAPKIYGDAKQVEDLTADRDRLKQELQELREQLDAKNKKDY